MKRLEDDEQEDPQSDMRIITSYSKLQNVNLIKPTLKRYLYEFTRSRFRRIDSEDFVTVITLMLPVQRFRKSSQSKVWEQTVENNIVFNLRQWKSTFLRQEQDSNK